MEIVNHIIYLLGSACFTFFVGRSLFRHGRPFLIECWETEKSADAVNMLFLVGFYLLNFAFVFIALRYGDTGGTLVRSLELLSWRIGLVALVIGIMHFNNLLLCELLRRSTAVQTNSVELGDGPQAGY